MSTARIQVSNISKEYKKYRSEWRRFCFWFGLFGDKSEKTQVLRNVCFSVNEGEGIGIVGQNGAGKSTLLKIIAGTLLPSNGNVHVVGQVSAILELGMGFSPELTGRENVYHSMGLMGHAPDKITGLIDDILDFSELGDYFDQPLRIYSSGMHARLAFSVATVIRPEVLIIDEALAVGDTYFQHKSFARIRQYKEQGTTLLIVSHDGAAVKSLCNRAILLDEGVLLQDGDPVNVLDYYNALLAEKEEKTISLSKQQGGLVQTKSGTGEAQVHEIGLFNAEGQQLEFVSVGEAVEMRIKVKASEHIPRLVLGYMIKDRLGHVVFGTNTHHTEQAIENVKKDSTIEFTVKFAANLGPGSYSVSTALVSTDTHLVNNYEWKDLALVFNVSNVSNTFFCGTSWLPPHIELEAS